MRLNRLFVFFVCSVLFASSLFGEEKKLQASDIVNRHLASIGTPEARAAAKSRTIRGTVRMTNLVGASGNVDGSAMMVSIGQRFTIAMRFPVEDYQGEQFVFDGKNVNVALIGPAKRSALGEFVYLHDMIVREGILGGTFLTSWPLLDTNVRQPRLKYDGLKKIDGRELHEISYSPKKGDRDLLIDLYFEPDTFRHVKTVYTYEVDPSFSHNQRVHGSFTKYRIEEEFSDFKVADGLTLPSVWKLRYSATSDKTVMTEWVITSSSVTENNVVD